jgi:hypothetical protein
VRVEPEIVRDRINLEAGFDPDLWVVSLEMRSDDAGATLAS